MKTPPAQRRHMPQWQTPISSVLGTAVNFTAPQRHRPDFLVIKRPSDLRRQRPGRQAFSSPGST